MGARAAAQENVIMENGFMRDYSKIVQTVMMEAGHARKSVWNVLAY